MQNTSGKISSLRARLDALFQDHEIYVRSSGQMRFLKISRTFQLRIAYIIAAALGIWLLITLGLIGKQLWSASHEAALNQREELISQSEERMGKSRDKINDLAERVQKRQDAMDKMMKDLGTPPAIDPKTPVKSAEEQKADDKLSAAVPELKPLFDAERRQLLTATALTLVASQRADQAEQAIRGFGLNPGALLADANTNEGGRGGPFIPASLARFFSDEEKVDENDVVLRLGQTLERLDRLERTLLAIPSSQPVAGGMDLSSGFGYRRDPFTGAAAMHAGLDFRGAHATPIHAASSGTVSFAGFRGGYGRCVEIDHGNGIITRYAHLSAINVQPGQKLTDQNIVGLMGSSGRSTGTHLHFEIRVNGQAIDPRPFMEANPNVLKVQAIAKRRVRGAVGV